MTKDTTVAARYARALFIVTEKRRETVAALGDLQAAFLVVKPGSRVGASLASPQLRLADKRKALQAAFEGRMVRSVALFVDLLVRKKRLSELATIVEEFEALVERAQGVQRARVVSAVGLSDAETKRLHAVLESWTQKKIKLTSDVDPSLLGGALVRIGDRVVDRSVRSLLDGMARQLYEANV
jgi:F-type H+-transporting ATPase subunit delta